MVRSTANHVFFTASALSAAAAAFRNRFPTPAGQFALKMTAIFYLFPAKFQQIFIDLDPPFVYTIA